MSRDRNPQHLHPLTLAAWKRLERSARRYLGLSLQRGEGYRLPALQNRDYRKGRDKNGNIIDRSKVVTNKRGTTGKHCLTRKSDGKPMSGAFHAWVKLPGGRLLGLRRLGPAGVIIYMALACLARQQGLRCGASWKDYTHFELRGKRWKQAQRDAAA